MKGDLEKKRWLVGEANFVKEVRSQARLPQRVRIFDETLREGEETPGVIMSVEGKVRIAKLLEELGVTETNVGYLGYIEEHAQLARELRKACPNLLLTGYIRAHGPAELETIEDKLKIALDVGVHKVDINIPCSDYQLAVKGMTRRQVIDITAKAIAKAREKDLEVTYGPYDTTRTEMNFLKAIIKVAEESGASRVRVYDTLGVLNPTATRWWVSQLVNTLDIPIQYHCHDDFGLAVANTCAAVEAGAKVIDLVVNQLGDRAGNCSFEETVLALEALYEVDTGIDLSGLCRLSQLVEEITGVKVPPNKAVVGGNTFIHESDIHVQAMLTGHSYTFEPYQPSVVGQKRRIYFGSTTSSDSVLMKGRQMGIDLSHDQLNEIMQKIRKIVTEREYAKEEEVEELIRSVSQ